MTRSMWLKPHQSSTIRSVIFLRLNDTKYAGRVFITIHWDLGIRHATLGAQLYCRVRQKRPLNFSQFPLANGTAVCENSGKENNQSLTRCIQSFVNFLLGKTVPFNFPPGNFGWMVHIVEIKPFFGFPETFLGNLPTIWHRFQTSEIFGILKCTQGNETEGRCHGP